MLARGTIVAGYRLDGVLGEGGMGTVYRATQLSLNRVVALKLLSGELSNDSGFRTRFEREGQLQAGLDHQNIVTVYEAGQTDQGLFLAMRLVDGPTLKDLILRGQLDPRRALRILAQVAQALDEAHAAGLIHRDIKPQNILIGKGDHTYLADFGLIKAPDDAALTGTGQFLGSIDYVAPEQIQGDRATAASDIYALTAVLYECLTDQVPFGRPNEAATLYAHVLSPPPEASELRPDLPPGIDEVITAGMAKQPADRPASASELIRRASGALTAAGGAKARPTQDRRGGPTGSAGPQHRHVTGRPLAPETVVATVQAPAAAGAMTAPGSPSAPTRANGTAEADRRARGARLAIALVAALAAVVAGFVVGHAGKSKSAPSFPSSAAAGHLELRYPARWLLGSSAGSTSVAGIAFDSPIVVTAPAPAPGTMTVGEVADSSGPTLLPAAFRGRLSQSLPASRPVSLGGLSAVSYSGLSLRGTSGTSSIYAVPTDAGVATVVCAGAGAAFQADCGRVAATLRLVGARAFPLGPNPAYARGLSATLTRLRAAVKAPLAALGTARTPAAQAAAGTRLSQAYAAAAGQLGRLTVSPLDRDSHLMVVAALGQLAAGYSRAATAVQQNRAGAYAAAGRQVSAGSGALAAALRGFTRLQYRVSS